MTNEGLSNVRLLLGEPDMEVRRSLASSLRGHGYRGIRETGDFNEIEEAVVNNEIDLLICDMDLGGDRIDDLIFKVRHHELGNNPFLVTIAMTLDPSVHQVRKIINCGSDDLLVKPVSVGALIERIQHLTDSRKDFVVTTDYIGPDRRKDPRPETQQITSFKVPNALKLRSEGKTDTADLQRAIDAATKMINHQKMERHAFQIDYLVKKIVPQYETAADDRVVPLLDRLQYVSEDLCRRMEGTDRSHIGELGKSIIEVVNTIQKTPLSPQQKDIQLLPELGQAIKRAFETGAEEASVAHDISKTVVKKK